MTEKTLPGKENFIFKCFKNAKYMERIEFILLAAILFIIQLLHINELSMPFVLEDEFGYLTHAATFAGLDWSSAAQYMSYYSYGYSILLAPIIAIFKDPAGMYQAILVLNALMIVGCFITAKCAAIKLAPEINGRLLNLAAFAVCLYPSYVVQSKIAWTECTLFLIFWALVLLVLSINEKPKMWKCALFAFLLIYAYAVHNRGLGIAAAGMITVILMVVLKHIRLRDAAVFFGIAAVAFVCYKMFNNDIIARIWQGEDGVIRNGLASQLTSAKLNYVLSSAGIKTVMKRLMGQAYYLFTATAGIGLIGFIELCSENVKTFAHCSKKYACKPFKEERNRYAYIFIILSVLATVAICTYFITGEGVQRADVIIYGRYNEIVMGPVMLLGFIAILKADKHLMLKASASAVLIAILAMLSYRWMLANNSGNYNSICAIGLAFLPEKGDFSALLKSALIAIIILLIICITLVYAKRTRRAGLSKIICAAAVLAVGCCFLYIGQANLKASVLSMAGANSKYKQIADYIEADNDEKLPVYYLIYENFDMDRTRDFIQFSMRDEKLICIKADELSKYPEDKYLIAYNSIDHEFLELTKNYEVRLMANDRVLMKSSEKQDSASGMEITGLYLGEGVTAENGEYTSTDKGGIFVFGPYFKLSQGSYDVTLDVELISGSSETPGYVEIAGNGGTDKYDVVKFTMDDFKDGKHSVKLHMEAPVDISRIELRVEAAKGVVLKISDVRLNIGQEAE